MSRQEFRLPDVGEGLAEAVVLTWLVAEGSPVAHMQPIVEVETAKSVVEIPSPVAGIMVSHGAEEGASLDVGEVLAVLESSEARRAVLTAPPAPSANRIMSRRVPAAPTVRRRAHELGIALDAVRGTGPAGRVLAADLDRYAAGEAGPGSPTTGSSPLIRRVAGAGARVEPLTRRRTAIASTLADAWSQVPLITDLRDADAVGLVMARKAIRRQFDAEPLTYTTLFAYIVCVALRRFPRFNASIDLEGGTMTFHEKIDLGIAVSSSEGLSVGIIGDAAQYSLRDLGAKVAEVAEAARAGRLTPAQSVGATFTVSSFGQFGGWYGTPLVVPPQVAIAGFGPVKDKVVPYRGEPAIRATLAMSVSADHRLIDGAELSEFASFIEDLVGDPILLLGS